MSGSAKAARHVGADEAAAVVRSGDWIDYGTTIVQPDAFDAALGRRVPELHDLKFRSCITMRPRAVLDADPTGERVTWFSWHFSGYDRKMHDAGLAHYQPSSIGEIPDCYRRFLEPPDVIVLKTRPMDADGWFNLSASNLWHRAILEAATPSTIVIVETNEHLPHCHGIDNAIHVSEVDLVIDGDGQPTPELPNAAITDIDHAVGSLIAGEIEEGSCLQIGIGAMPNAVCASLLESGVRHLGVHTEMLTDGLVDLYLSGQIDNSRKTLSPGRTVYSFGLGTDRTYRTIDGNEDFLCCPIEYTNLPHTVMQNDRVVSINNTTQIDLQGQAASESDGHRHISGTGGQLQFVRAAYASNGGKSFICLSSTFDKKGERRSRIVLDLTPGNVVTTPRTDMMYVVTEYGLVNLKGRSLADRARLLISIAHPDFRDDLERQARDARVIPRSYH
jgi:acyl-CoA hydrolase